MANLNKLKIANFISFIPFGFGAFISFRFLDEYNKKKIERVTTLFLMAFFIPLFSSEILKKMLFKRFEGTERPDGARGCDFFSIGPDVSGNPGFPSGHMSVTSGVCILYILFLIKSPNFAEAYSLRKRILLICLNILAIILMAWARHYKKCHNFVQIIGGIVLGSFTSALIFSFKNINKIDLNQYLFN